MQIVIDIKDDDYYDIIGDALIGEHTTREVINAVKDGTPLPKALPKGHGRIGDLSELETRIGNFIEHYNNLLKDTNPEALVYMNHILDGIIDTDTIIEADREVEG